MTNDLRVELRTRNNILWHAIFDSHQTVAEFCRVHGFDQGLVGGWLNLTISPYLTKTTRRGRAGSLTARAQRVSDTLGVLGEDLFPDDLYSGRIPVKMAAEIPSHLHCGLNAAKHLALPPMQENDVDAREAREALCSVLASLTPREEKVMRMRFGIGGEKEHTLEEIGAKFGVVPERVRQIEGKAIRKLRHPSRSRKLRIFLEGRKHPED